MNKFKVGDKVVCTDAFSKSAISEGRVYKVRCVYDDSVGVEEKTGLFCHSRFELAPQYPNPPHKHAELIKEWADGAAIQYFNSDGEWMDVLCNKPYWCDADEYRIKPVETKSPNQIEKERIQAEMRKLEQALSKLDV